MLVEHYDNDLLWEDHESYDKPLAVSPDITMLMSFANEKVKPFQLEWQKAEYGNVEYETQIVNEYSYRIEKITFIQ